MAFLSDNRSISNYPGDNVNIEHQLGKLINNKSTQLHGNPTYEILNMRKPIVTPNWPLSPVAVSRRGWVIRIAEICVSVSEAMIGVRCWGLKHLCNTVLTYYRRNAVSHVGSRCSLALQFMILLESFPPPGILLPLWLSFA